MGFKIRAGVLKQYIPEPGDKEIVIPKNVREIAEGAFCPEERYNKELERVIIPEGVISIGKYAFEDCVGLTSIVIPDSVTEIGKGAFFNCNRLTSVTLPKGITYIAENAFYACKSLTEIRIPDSVTNIGGDAFRGCKKLTAIRIPDGVTMIGSFAFGNCDSLTSVFIPENVTSVTESTFRGCNGLSELIVHENNPSYASMDGVLYTKDMRVLICYPPGKADKSFTIPDTVTYIRAHAFSDTVFLEEITLKAFSLSRGRNCGNGDFSDSSFWYCRSIRQVNGIAESQIPDYVHMFRNAFPDYLADVLLNGKAKDRKEYLTYTWDTNLIVETALRQLHEISCTKKQLSNLAEFCDDKRDEVTAKNFAAVYEILQAQKADKALALIPIMSVVEERMRRNDPDVELLPDTKGRTRGFYTH